MSDDHDLYGREAIGAFAHELRTPLTSIRMVLELARREGAVGGELVLDRELASMLLTSVDDLQELADELQETSRLERRKGTLRRGPCELRQAVDAAFGMVAPDLVINGDAPPAIDGPWDHVHLASAIAGFARSVNRIGEGTGEVQLGFEVTPEHVRLQLRSGTPGGEPRLIAADAGFSFFRARQSVLAMDGRVEWMRSERHLSVIVELPR